MWVMAIRMLMIFFFFFCTRLLCEFLLYFQPLLPLGSHRHVPLRHGGKVGISMWKGSCRQCYALCIHSICMKCGSCHMCEPIIWGQYFRPSAGGKKRDTSKSYTFYSSQWNVTYHPEEHQMQGRVRSIKTCWGASGRNDRRMSRVNEEEALPRGAFRLWHLLCSWRLRGDIFQRHPFYAWLSGGLRARRKSYRQKLFAIPHDFRIILFK